ncbi:hypothetical protein N0V86_003689 [Didymella sp. IMI 355093]|nr:hypothetical protein N0V86_003689 [Didymella sp. IMI 355093]
MPPNIKIKKEEDSNINRSYALEDFAPNNVKAKKNALKRLKSNAKYIGAAQVKRLLLKEKILKNLEESRFKGYTNKDIVNNNKEGKDKAEDKGKDEAEDRGKDKAKDKGKEPV